MKKSILLGLGTSSILICAATASLFMPRKEKAKRKGLPSIVCIGDSITFGHGVILTRNHDAWPRILEHKLQEKYAVLNFGFSGSTLLKEGDQPYRPDFWRAAQDRRAQIYLLMLGTNDSKPYNWDAKRYAEQLDERVRELKAIPSAKRICLVAPPPAFKISSEDAYAAFDIDPAVIRDKIRPIVKETAEKNDVEFIDLYAPMEGHSEYMADGVHPNREGNEMIATRIVEHLNREQDEAQ